MPGVPPRMLEADDDLARTREQFLTSGPVDEGGVREAILASWWRSRQADVAADAVDLHYVRDPNLDTPLTRSAEPVLRHLSEQLDGQSLAIVLTDPSGVVLTRFTGDLALERRLDSVNLAPGFSYAEEFVGTNGIGTALEAGRPMHVFGHEHYAEDLEELACAGVPIRHPVTGKTVGALDLTCWRKDAGPLLVTLAKTTAEQIRQALLTETGVRELELLHEYLRACHRSSGMVFALNNDVVMMNETARLELSPLDQAGLLRYAAEALAGRLESSVVSLPTGTRVRMHTRPVRGDGGLAGGVIDVRVVDPAAVTQVPTQRMLLPGLVGSSALWRRACAEAEAVRRDGSWLVVQGEAGAGKLAVVRAVQQRVSPTGRMVVLDGELSGGPEWPADLRAAVAAVSGGSGAAGSTGAVVLRHLERLDPATLRALTAALQDVPEQGRPWVAVCVRDVDAGSTAGPGGTAGVGHGTAGAGRAGMAAPAAGVVASGPPDGLAAMLRLCPSTVQVPPLRHRVDDVQELVPFLLRRLGHAQLRCSWEAMQQLQRATWPGNVEQLLQTLRQVTRLRRSGVVVASDVPSDIGVISRRRLTTLESMERDAIVRSLADTAGNKTEAARGLGMSRATIYRKIHDYGLSGAG